MDIVHISLDALGRPRLLTGSSKDDSHEHLNERNCSCMFGQSCAASLLAAFLIETTSTANSAASSPASEAFTPVEQTQTSRPSPLHAQSPSPRIFNKKILTVDTEVLARSLACSLTPHLLS
eukprot:864952-Rhodomonas_salina.1